MLLKLTIRIYKRHDLDLLFLYKQDSEFDFKEEMKKALKGYIHEKPVRNKVPTGSCVAICDLPSNVQFHIMLDNKKDNDIIAWVNSITRGRRNNIIKNVFRNTFPPIELPYKKESEKNKIS